MSGAWKGNEQEVTANGHRVSLWGDKNVLKSNNEDGTQPWKCAKSQ